MLQQRTHRSFVERGTINDLVGVVGGTEELIWYGAATGGTQLASTEALTSTTYYAVSKSTVTGCESVRTPVVVTIKPTPSFTLGTVSQITTCSGVDGAIELTGLTASTNLHTRI